MFNDTVESQRVFDLTDDQATLVILAHWPLIRYDVFLMRALAPGYYSGSMKSNTKQGLDKYDCPMP